MFLGIVQEHIDVPNNLAYYRDEEYTHCKCGYAGQFLQLVFQDAYSSFDPKMKVIDSIKECSKNSSFSMLKRVEPTWQLREKGLQRAWKAYMIVRKLHRLSHI
jgi:ABC-type dipeptide/oligopeptide/nickel transport system ATPase subunit